MRVNLVVAQSVASRGIGKAGGLPWSLKGDMKFFKDITTATCSEGQKNAVIMGRKTWESIPEKHRPLPDRLNIVLSKNMTPEQLPAGVLLASCLEDAVQQIMQQQRGSIDRVFVIGGSTVYEQVLQLDAEREGGVHAQSEPNAIEIDRIYVTRVAVKRPEGFFDAFFPALDEKKYVCVGVSETHVDSDRMSGDKLSYDFCVYERRNAAHVIEKETRPHSTASSALNTTRRSTNEVPMFSVSDRGHEEYRYLELIREVINTGVEQDDRTGTGVRSVFGRQMRFNLRESFPLLTTKRVFWKGVVEELLWFIRGDTNAKHLSDKGVKIWDANGSKDFLEKRGLGHREEGDLGPVYGFQWRHFGAEYKDFNTDYTGQGVDQLAECIKLIKENPTDRRILLTAWNPADLKLMALPPCHMFCQFYVANGELSCLLYQRSCDLGLGVPFNIASYALLTLMMAQVCGLKPGEFVHTLGNAHVYKNHIEPLKTQLERVPRPFPVLKMNPNKTDIDSFEFSDFELLGYDPHPTVKMDMAV